MKKALVIGIDAYTTHPLGGAVNDAVAVANTIERNGDGSPNFSVRLLVSNQQQVTTALLAEAVTDLFTGDAETAMLYFAGHGILDGSNNSGYLVSQSGSKGAWGLSLTDLLAQANKAYPRIRSSVIILDSCHSGFVGEVPSIGNDQLGLIGTGVTILTAAHREQKAAEEKGHGLFTGLLLDGLNGSASDILGNVTPASLYSLVDQTLGVWEQRPIYKANVQTFITLRQVGPKVPLEVLRKLPRYFEEPSSIFMLDPSFEPDRQNIPEELRLVPVNPLNAAIFRELQQCNRHGLVTPLADHMYDAAIHSKGCKLTATGAHYRRLAEMKRL